MIQGEDVACTDERTARCSWRHGKLSYPFPADAEVYRQRRRETIPELPLDMPYVEQVIVGKLNLQRSRSIRGVHPKKRFP